MWANRHRKQMQREMLFDGLAPLRRYLTLPGAECQDVLTGMLAGKLTTETELIGIERDVLTYHAMCGWLAGRWRGPCRTVHGPLHTVKVYKPVDLAFIDLLGNLGAWESYWIRHDLQLIDHGRLGLTVLRQARANVFIPAVEHLLQSRYRQYYTQTQREARNQRVPGDLLGVAAIYVILLRCYLLARADYEIRVIPYGEAGAHSLMLFFHVDNIRHVGDNALTETEVKVEADLIRLVEQQKARAYVPADNTSETEVYDVSKIQDMVAKFRQVTALPNRRQRYNKIRGLNRQITVFANQSENPDYARRCVRRAMTQAGLDWSLLTNNHLED